MFIIFYKYLRNFKDKFFNSTRMSTSYFDELLNKIERKITGMTTNMRACICPEEKLSVTHFILL
nr:unnamed protein product [Callosobruchus analis]